MHDYCKNDKITCNTCESSGICYCSDEQVTSGFQKNEDAKSDEAQLQRIQERWEHEARTEARRKLSEYNERKRNLIALGMPEATASQLATSETMENEIKHSRFVFPVNFDQLSGEQKLKVIDKARRMERGEET
jgi:hypothetical protein